MIPKKELMKTFKISEIQTNAILEIRLRQLAKLEQIKLEEEKGDLFKYLVDLGYTGYFFHVTQKDHANIFRRGIGEYIHFSKHREYEYCRPGVEHRNYYFMKKGDHP